MSEICARQHRDELAAADVVEDLQGPIWSQLRQVQVGCQFLEKVAVGFEKTTCTRGGAIGDRPTEGVAPKWGRFHHSFGVAKCFLIRRNAS